MGYTFGSGSAALKDNINKKELFERLDEKVKDMYDFEYNSDGSLIYINDTCIYNEDDTVKFLNILAPYITEGEVEYCGDEDYEDYHWKFTFNRETEKWDKIEGEVCYSLKEFADENLIKELECRGYVITK